MCSLYSEKKSREVLANHFGVIGNRAAAFEPLDAIFPGHDAPVVRLAADDEREISILSWGFVLPQKGRAAKRVTNTRDDKLRSSPFWRASFEERRCLVPATSFAEPKGKPAVWYWFGLSNDEARPLFAFAGIWRSWKGPLKSQAESIEMDVYSILTTTPNVLVKPIHPNRMPVMLAGEEQYDTWLNGTADEASRLVRPYPAEAMRIVHEGDKKDAA